MKSTLSPDLIAHLDFLIDSIDELYEAAFLDLEPYEMGKISTARGDLAFVRARVNPKPVKLVVLEPEEVPVS